jgi:hypothetical protein
MLRAKRWPITALVWVGVCLLQPAQASAQESDALSRELADAILRYAFRYDGGNVRVLQGRVPDDLKPNFHAPPGTRILGSVVMGSGVLVLATSTAAPESLRAEYTRALAPRGWAPLEPMRRGGFVQARTELPLTLCREGAQLHVQHSARRGTPNDLFLHYREDSGGCEQPRAVFREMSEPRFPTLYAPPGASEPRRCYSGGGGARGSMGTSTMVPAGMDAHELLRHYAAQVESSGWRPIGGSGRTAATGTWTRADSSGTAELTLHVRETRPSGVGCYQVEMSVTDGRAR